MFVINLGLILIVPAFIFTLFLALNTYDLIRQSNYDYIIEINNQHSALSKIGYWCHRRVYKSIMFSDIKYAEYYPYLDSASIIFHTSKSDFEMPMGDSTRDAVDFWAATGVNIVDVQSDEAIPD